jgi:hypothetical protein
VSSEVNQDINLVLTNKFSQMALCELRDVLPMTTGSLHLPTEPCRLGVLKNERIVQRE